MSDMPNSDQRAFWSEEAGHKWVAEQEVMDTLLEPVLDGLMSRVPFEQGDHVLDIGCGAGTSTMRAGARVGLSGHATGVDISHTLLALAKDRAEVENVSYHHADAATFPFEQQAFDHLISRFGVMFFDDTNAAFSNIIKALKPGSHVHLATWGAIDQNPYFKLAAKAARDVLGPMPKSDPDAPGPFAMRDPERIIPILSASGLKDVEAEKVALVLTPPGGLQGFSDIASKIGPAEASMRHFEASPDQRAEVRKTLIETFEPFQTDKGDVEIPAEIIFYRARS